MFLRLAIARWPAYCPWLIQQDELLPPAVAVAGDDGGYTPSLIWAQTSVTALPVWAVPQDEQAPITGLDDSGWSPATPWGESRAAGLLWADDPGVPQLWLEEDAWRVPCPWEMPWGGLLTCGQDESSGLVTGLDDTAWIPACIWPTRWVVAGSPWLDEEISPASALSGDEDGWLAPLRWATDWIGLGLPLDDQALPTLFVIAEEDGWQPALAWPWAWGQRCLLWLQDELGFIAPTLGVEEGAWLAPSPWPLPAGALRLWEPDALPVSVFDEDAWQPQVPCGNVWASLLQWDTDALPVGLGEDGWAAVPTVWIASPAWQQWWEPDALPLGLDEDPWFSPTPWPSLHLWRPVWADDQAFPTLFVIAEGDGWHVIRRPWDAWQYHARWVSDDDLPGASLPTPFGLDEDGWTPRLAWEASAFWIRMGRQLEDSGGDFVLPLMIHGVSDQVRQSGGVSDQVRQSGGVSDQVRQSGGTTDRLL